MKPLVLLGIFCGIAAAQVPNPTQGKQPAAPAPGQPMPIFRVTVVSRTTKAINYHHRTGSTPIEFRGTELMPAAKGDAVVKSEMGSTKIDTTMHHMTAANQFGPEYMTYVLWAITPEGRANNLGEVVLEGDHAHLNSTTDLQAFGLIVTAEPYFAVTQPSNVVVAENFVTKDTTGTIEEVDAKYELLQRGQYTLNRSDFAPVRVNPKGPLQLAEAENAVAIARLSGAQTYAADTFQKALVDLQNAEGFLSHGGNRKECETNAREAAQMAEDARIITYRKIRQEELDNERAVAAKRQADAQAAAQRNAEQARLEQERRQVAENDRRQSEQARLQAEEAKRQADMAAAQASQQKAEADAARAAALAQQQAAQAEAERAKQAVQQAEGEKTQLRERLREQLNTILETRETARGLIVNISDVLFDFNQYTLKPGAREKLAKVSGILLGHPDLSIKLEGYTDAIGSDAYNQKLSEERAGSVLAYLQSQGVPGEHLSAVGFGKTNPVATNDTADGRQRNRRVEMVVSGESIGLQGQQ
jgi:outer membrane protein OmpA-like peptidoglycan-associated protein